jgi:predicted nucleic acid-binding protein
MAAHPQPLIFTPLHRIEVRNAFRNLAALGQMREEECRSAFHRIDDDLRQEILVHTSVTWTNIFRRADELSEAHADRHGQRTIDLLHVALALDAGARTFLSFDRRQRQLAQSAGLKVRP